MFLGRTTSDRWVGRPQSATYVLAAAEVGQLPDEQERVADASKVGGRGVSATRVRNPLHDPLLLVAMPAVELDVLVDDLGDVVREPHDVLLQALADVLGRQAHQATRAHDDDAGAPTVKLRMSQKPKMACTFCPGMTASSAAVVFRFFRMTSRPASPNPSASNWTIFEID